MNQSMLIRNAIINLVTIHAVFEFYNKLFILGVLEEKLKFELLFGFFVLLYLSYRLFQAKKIAS